MLYVVATPIGHPEDITLRALRTLREVDLIAAEDIRVTRPLLQQHAIPTELISYRPRRNAAPLRALLDRLRAGQNIALVCDAGTPTIADPGSELIVAALQAGGRVTSVPGPVAAIAALVASGLPPGRFAFDGFPPRTRAGRQAFFAALAQERRTILLYESAAALRATLQMLRDALGPSRAIVIARLLTQPTESLFRGTLAEAASLPIRRGEYTLVIAGKDTSP